MSVVFGVILSEFVDVQIGIRYLSRVSGIILPEFVDIQIGIC